MEVSKIITSETTKYPQTKGLSPAVFEKEICDIWSVKKVNDIENIAIKSDKPILLISGEYDNETPAKWASAMKDNLSNSYHLIFKGWSHTPINVPCKPQITSSITQIKNRIQNV